MSIDVRAGSKKRMEEDSLRFPKSLVEFQHKLNKELLHEQHQLNLVIHNKQAKLLKWSMISTIVAALLGALAGFALSTKHQSSTQELMPRANEIIIIQQKANKEKVSPHKKTHEQRVIFLTEL